MRMIGIGLMTALLAAIAMLLGQQGFWASGWQVLRGMVTDAPGLVFETPSTTDLPAGSSGFAAQIPRATPQGPLILSGLPAYQSASFLLPVEARALSGYLHIDASVQALTGVEAVLRVSIDKTRRAELLLHPDRLSGGAGRSLRIPLSPLDLSRERLVVSFSLQGRSAQAPCGPEDGTPAIVEIETTSHLALTLDRPLTGLRDRVVGWGGAVQVGWPGQGNRAAALARLMAAGQAQRGGVPVRFAPHGLAADEVLHLLPDLTAPEVADPVTSPWPRPVAVGANAGLRQFHRATSWRFRAGQPGDRRVSGRLRLDLYLGQLSAQARWTVTVTLDGRLLREVAAPAGPLTRDIPLPANTPPSAMIEVTAYAHIPRPHLCDEGPELLAELRPGSLLLPGAMRQDDPLERLRKGLEGAPIGLALPQELALPDAARAATLLGALLPKDMAWRAVRPERARILVVGGGHDLSRWVEMPGWLLDHTGLRPLHTVHPARTGSAALLIRPDPGQSG